MLNSIDVGILVMFICRRIRVVLRCLVNMLGRVKIRCLVLSWIC